MTSIMGSGPDLALIHGWGLGSWVWQAVLDRLSRNCRVHVVDLPGYARSPADGDARKTFPDFLATAQTLLDALPERITLCGWSLGGLLAMRAALLAPERVSGLILVGSTPCFMQRADWQGAQTPALLGSFSASVQAQPEQTLQRFAALLSQGDARAREITRTLLAGLRKAPVPDSDALRCGLEWLREVDLRPLLPTIATRCLLIHGENDSLNPLAAAVCASGQLANAQLDVFDGVGHVPFLANPERFARLLDDFCHVPVTA
ncbi:alpha/beta fold hydrolase [Candidatus Accumulibacter sp. ACC007]|uniref:alpha/beta fold hydrolase n=1 Tax=Candidatus Accumulibacter sp. ACC007 TaxID=2823333 RepID=UPI0025C0FFC8|nr:alpha/beta fold hydrolase [Candidatus Accumulibacter sp. ACC007]